MGKALGRAWFLPDDRPVRVGITFSLGWKSEKLNSPQSSLESESSPPNTYEFYSTLKAHLSRSGQGSGPVWLLAHLY